MVSCLAARIQSEDVLVGERLFPRHRLRRALPPDSLQARICTYECTFCADCVETTLRGVCPNCGGELVRRPRRTAFMWSSARAAKSIVEAVANLQDARVVFARS